MSMLNAVFIGMALASSQNIDLVFSPHSVIEEERDLNIFLTHLKPGGQLFMAGECDDLNQVGTLLSHSGFIQITVEDQISKGLFEAWKE